MASWGSPPGLRRVARHGDGWLASAYNITPERFRTAAAAGVVAGMPNALATAWLYITEDAGGAERVLSEVLAPLVGRPVDELRSQALPIGPAEVCAERMRAFADAGAQRVFLWPLRDAARQIELFMERVAPRLRTGPPEPLATQGVVGHGEPDRRALRHEPQQRELGGARSGSSFPRAISTATSWVVSPSGKRRRSGSGPSGGGAARQVEVRHQDVVGRERLPAARHQPRTVALEHQRRRREAHGPVGHGRLALELGG